MQFYAKFRPDFQDRIRGKTFLLCYFYITGFVRIAPSSSPSFQTNDDAPTSLKLEDDVLDSRKRKRAPVKTTKSKKAKLTEQIFDYLDQTWIHPESYDVTRK